MSAIFEMCERLGFALVDWHQRKLAQLSFWQRRRKEAGLPVVEEEDVLVFRKSSHSEDATDNTK